MGYLRFKYRCTVLTVIVFSLLIYLSLTNHCRIYQQAKSKNKPVTEEEFVVMKREYLAMQKKVFDAAFRLQDNRKQAAKGQPSLDGEDTGVQWKNDDA
jgi:hypothetical protein